MVTAGIILVNVAVFALTWPQEKAMTSVVGGEHKRNMARRMILVLESSPSISERDRIFMRTAVDAPDFPSPGLNSLFERTEDSKNTLPSKILFEWEALYPLYRSYLTSLSVQPKSTRPFYAYGFLSHGNKWGVVTHLFLHAGCLHLFFNMLFLWAFAGAIEPFVRGHVVSLYAGGGISAALCQLAWGIPPDVPMIGASGAISAIMGFGLTALPRLKTKIFYLLAPVISVKYGCFDAPLWFFLPLWFFQQVILALVTRGNEAVEVGYGAHLGGFIVGGVLGLLAHWINPGRFKLSEEESVW